MSIRAVEPLYRNTDGTITLQHTDTNVQFGARVLWSDPARNDPATGDKRYLITQLPNSLSTAVAVESYFNTIVAPASNPNQTRLGALLGGYAWVRCNAFTKNVSIDMEWSVSDSPYVDGNPFLLG